MNCFEFLSSRLFALAIQYPPATSFFPSPAGGLANSLLYMLFVSEFTSPEIVFSNVSLSALFPMYFVLPLMGTATLWAFEIKPV